MTYAQSQPSDWRHPGWKPPELGLTRATAFAFLIVAVMLGVIVAFWPAKPQPKPIIVTQARLVTLPPPPPPPPEVVQPPEPLPQPPITPPEAPVQAKIQIQKPPPKPVHHHVKQPPLPKVEPQPDTPPPPVTSPRTETPQPPAQHTTNFASYGRALHGKIQSNVEVPAAIEQLGLSGTALISFTLSPDGSLVSARVARSSGNPLIDKAALEAVRRTNYQDFAEYRASGGVPFTVPIEITGSGGD